MVFIIGGYAQGKVKYAEENFKGRKIFRLNDWAWDKMCNKEDPLTIIKDMAERDPDMVIVSTEIGNGIIPLDRTERERRDAIGHLQVEIAKEADTVIRVTCGIGQKIK